MAKTILFDDVARAALKKGIDKLASAVRITLGPRGRAVVIEKGYGAPQVTFDGVTVAKEIELEDKYENLGAEFLKQAADKTNDNVGDGTTTAVVLAHALIEEGEKAVKAKGFNVIQFAEALRSAARRVIAKLEDQRELIDSNKKIEEVATLSAKNTEIGALIAKVMEEIGKEGVVAIEDSNTVGNSHEIVEGLQFDRGYISPYMITNSEKMESSLEEPRLLVTDQKISAINDILPILEKLVQNGKKELVVVAEEVEGEALATLVVNKLRGIFTVLAVKAPGFGDRRKEMLQDIATVTGAEFISEEVGKKLANATLESLGSARRVTANKDTTTIVGGKGEKGEIEKRVAQLRAQIEKTDSEYDKEKLQERLGKLSGGVAVIKVGAPTESAQKELKQRVEDAVAATRAAMEEGIVPGGGIALFNVNAFGVGGAEDGKVAEAAGRVLGRVIEVPLRAIIENSGDNPDLVIEKILAEKAKNQNGWVGFNAATGEVGDLKAAGIVDPLKVTKTALMNAVSVAANYLTIGAAIIEVPKKEEKGGHGGHAHEEF